MGWIRRNRFWFEHHDLYIEPTEEEKLIARIEAHQSRARARNILAATVMLQGILQNDHRR